MLDRRQFLATTSACACCTIGPPTEGLAPALPDKDGGCGVPADQIKRVFPKILSVHELAESRQAFHSAFGGGASARDAALVKAIGRLSASFEIAPKFGFFDDREFAPAGNALAWRPDTKERPNGAVTFGIVLFDRLMSEDPIGASVLAVLAHEFGHVALYMSGKEAEVREGRPTAKRVELHADFLAGYYLGVRKREAAGVSLYNAGRLIWSIGDQAFDSKHHHGTRAERNAAAEAGFKVGHGSAPPIREAFERATRYIRTTYANDRL